MNSQYRNLPSVVNRNIPPSNEIFPHYNRDMENESLQKIVERIDIRLDVIGESAKTVSLRAKQGGGYISDLKATATGRKPGKGLTTVSLMAILKELKTTPNWVLTGNDPQCDEAGNILPGFEVLALPPPPNDADDDDLLEKAIRLTDEYLKMTFKGEETSQDKKIRMISRFAKAIKNGEI